MKARIILENGLEVVGKSLMPISDTYCELVFNTSMAGYEEVLTDASYKNQGVVMTYPTIGNYGITEDSIEHSTYLSCFIVHELARIGSNFRAKQNIIPFLKERNINTVYDVDTRMLARKIRDNGTMIALITNNQYSVEECVDKIKQYKSTNIGNSIETKQKEVRGDGNTNVAILDLGSKKDIIYSLIRRNCKVTVYPYNSKDILSEKYDAIFLSEGPGDPVEYSDSLEIIKQIYSSNTPVFAIGLGHQLMAIANGAKTEKLKQGHRGTNIPIKDVKTSKTYIVSQNHGFVVHEPNKIAEIIYINANDKTIEGLKYINKNIITTQFNPDSSTDTEFILDDFIKNIQK